MKKTNQPAQGYDIIGDIHGHAQELASLLDALGYTQKNGHYAHPDNRKVIFLGDYIDRGPMIREVLRTVRSMVDGGSALAILGNHEINALRFHTIGSSGKPLRPHSENNTRQHQATLDQFADNMQEWTDWMQWFSGLPLFLDLPGLRAVHACWDDEAIDQLREIGPLQGETLENHSIKKTSGYEIMSQIVNGPEGILPRGYRHETADGTMRSEFRLKWWLDLSLATCQEAVFPANETVPDVFPEYMPQTGYPENAPITFFGHYALKHTEPAPIRSNLACLDYGTGKGGFLCAYRWDGETTIDPTKFVTTKQPTRRGYRVLVDDNFHYMDEDERWCLGEFDNYEVALIAARQLVEDFFSDAKPGQTAKELYDGYTSFGDDPFIIAFGGADQPESRFSAWGYAKHLASELEKNSGVAPPLSLPLCESEPMSANHRANETGDSRSPQSLQEE